MMKLLLPFFIFCTLFVSFATTVNAHVRYLVDETAVASHGGQDYSFLFRALTDPQHIGLIFWTLAGLIILLLLGTQIRAIKREVKRIGKKATSYKTFTPWMLRLSLGIALIGSGTAQTLVSPVLDSYVAFGTLQIFLGFLLMAGFLVIPAAIAALGIYVFALTTDWYILGNLDFAATALALIFLDNEKPGLDDMLGLPKISPFRTLQHFAPFILRVGIGGAMIFLALYEKIFNPHLSAIIVHEFGLMNIVPVSPEMWVLSSGLIELVIGLCLLLGLFTRITSAIAFIVLSLSFFYFGEDVSSHITLFGILSVLFITQAGPWSLDEKFKQKPKGKIKGKEKKKRAVKTKKQ